MTRKSKTQVPMVYVGPDLPGGVLKRYTVFREGYPPHIQELRDKSPSLCGLFVCLSELAAARRRVRVQGDLMNTLSKQILKEI